MKKILLIILAIVVLIVLGGFLLPAKVEVQSTIVSKAPAYILYGQVNHLQDWEKWSPWHKIDPEMQLSYYGPEEGIGAGYEWKSNHSDVGNGKLTIVNTEENHAVDCTMEFTGHGIATSRFVFDETTEGTQITWSMQSDMGMNPIARWMGVLFMANAVEKDFQKGLNDLVAVSEAIPVMKVEERERPETHYISINASVAETEIGETLGNLYEELMTYAEKNKTEVAGAPFALYFSYTPEKIEMAACIPVAKKLKNQGNIIAGTLTPGKNAEIDFYGPYEKTGDAHNFMDRWMQSTGNTPSGPPYEIYVTDPGEVQDPAKWLTKVCYPLN